MVLFYENTNFFMNNLFDRHFIISKTNPLYEQAKIISEGLDLPIGRVLKMAKEKGIQFLMNTYIEIKKSDFPNKKGWFVNAVKNQEIIWTGKKNS